ncbi:MAG: Yip1 family protein [Syntrophales bacterium]|nr:Yip1 family protein [Syntrophales bacterium]
MNIVERVKRILLDPKQEWEVISRETTSTSELYKGYIMPLAAIGPVAFIIGVSIVGINLPGVGPSFRLPITTSIGSAVVQYVLNLVGVYVLALIVDFLAPNFSGEKNSDQALKLAAYSYTAGWLSGIFVMIPALGFLMVLGLYGLYLIYTGIPVLMKAPREKALGYTVTVVIAAIVIAAIIGWVSRFFISYPMPR